MEDINSANSYQDNRSNSSKDYLQRAARAVDMGDKTLGIHLYLAAFERAVHENLLPSNDSLEGMEIAWKLAVDTRQRSLAEYIFEKLEPFWTPEEMASHADELQRLALDKLEEFGLTREAIEDMAEMVNQDLLGITPDVLCHFEDMEAMAQDKKENTDELNSSSEAPISSHQEAETHESASSDVSPKNNTPSFEMPHLIFSKSQKKQVKEKEAPAPVRFDYRSISGFESVIEKMGKLGIGKSRDRQFQDFISMLNVRHGLSQMPSTGTLIFSSEAREDANYFMVATVGEMGLPAVRMRMETNMQGQPVLFVMASADMRQRLSSVSRAGFNLPAILILEDLDLWDLPLFDYTSDEQPGFIQMQMSRGAREALALIQTALDTPEVTVFISAAHPEHIDERFSEALGIHRIIPIALPNDQERKSVWRAAQQAHPSLRGLDVLEMVKYSKGLSRFDIFAVTTEAVEYAYRESVASGEFRAVATSDILLRLSNFFPLESQEYQNMEDVVVKEFSRTNFDDLLNNNQFE